MTTRLSQVKQLSNLFTAAKNEAPGDSDKVLQYRAVRFLLSHNLRKEMVLAIGHQSN